MKELFTSKNLKTNSLCFIFSLFILSTVLTTPWLVKAFLYALTLGGLLLMNSFKETIRDNFLKYLPYLIFTLVCLFSYLLVGSHNIQNSKSPEIEDIVAFFILFVFLISWRVSYLQIMNILVLTISSFLLISIPIHIFYLDISFLSGTAFFYQFDQETLSNKNTLGILLGCILPFSLHKLSEKISIYNYLVLMILNVSIFYTFSRAALIISILGTLLLLFSGRKSFFKASSISIASVLLLLFVFEISPQKYNEMKSESNLHVLKNNYKISESEKFNSTNNLNKTFSSEGSRYKYLISSYEGFLEKPLIGHGLTTFKANHKILDKEGNILRNPVTHNDFAQIAYELGFIGLLSFLYLFLFNFINLYKNTSLKCDQSIIILIQLIVLAASLNSGNYFDHALFWAMMAITLKKIKLT